MHISDVDAHCLHEAQSQSLRVTKNTPAQRWCDRLFHPPSRRLAFSLSLPGGCPPSLHRHAALLLLLLIIKT